MRIARIVETVGNDDDVVETGDDVVGIGDEPPAELPGECRPLNSVQDGHDARVQFSAGPSALLPKCSKRRRQNLDYRGKGLVMK